MKSNPKPIRCAIYTRVSTDHALEQEFNSLDNQREASEAYIKSQAHEGWRCLPTRYDDGGFSGGSMDRPALQQLLSDIRARLIDVVVVYKVDRLTRSLADFAKLVDLFDRHKVSPSRKHSIPRPAWEGSPLPSSSARSRPSASATRSPRRDGRASGPAA